MSLAVFGKIPWRKEMATHSSILTKEAPWTEEPGTLVHGEARVGHDWATNTDKGRPEPSAAVHNPGHLWEPPMNSPGWPLKWRTRKSPLQLPGFSNARITHKGTIKANYHSLYCAKPSTGCGPGAAGLSEPPSRGFFLQGPPHKGSLKLPFPFLPIFIK